MAELQTPQVFLKDFMKCAEMAKTSVRLQSMNFETGKAMNALEKTLIAASARGVKVEIYFDWVASKYMHGELPILPIMDSEKRRYFQELHEKNRKMHERFRNGKVTLGVNNIPSRLTSWFPIFRRNHKKMYVVDDAIAWIGGVNLFDLGFEMVDFMVKFTDPDIVKHLVNEYDKNSTKTTKGDFSIKCTNNYTLYVDSGIVGKSLIYDTARVRVKTAKKSIIFMSQYVPDSLLLSDLTRAARKGVEVIIITSMEDDDNFTKYPEKLTYQLLHMQLKRHSGMRLVHIAERVHAKLLLIDNRLALFGSHNYTHTGPLLGTEEIMMETDDTDLLMQIKRFLREYKITT